MRRSGLTRAQLRYAEERAHLGTVARSADGRRLYDPEQLRWLEMLGGCESWD
jgi:DNA-binding transcriptional MerR regulator